MGNFCEQICKIAKDFDGISVAIEMGMATNNPLQQEHWLDDQRHEHGICRCGHDCSTHPDAGNPLVFCGDCGADTCPDCRVEDSASRCVECASEFYA